MENKKSVIFKPADVDFKPAEKRTKKEWFDTSYYGNERAIGNLRFTQAYSANYNRKHPILDKEDNVVGYLSNGLKTIDYSWSCIYVANCFWITNKFRHTLTDSLEATLGITNPSHITLVDSVGYYPFSSAKRFKVIKRFDFEGSPLARNWTDKERAFKLLDGDKLLFYLTQEGFSLFDTYRRERISYVKFPYPVEKFDFTLSPKVKILAIAGNTFKGKDLVDGKDRYQNYIWLYDLISGEMLGEKMLDMDTAERWSINFSETGRNLKVSSDSFTYQFELVTE